MNFCPHCGARLAPAATQTTQAKPSTPAARAVVATKRQLVTVREYSAASTFSENTLRWWIFNAANNGLDTTGALVRVGRRVYLDPAKLDAWLDTQRP